jgi:hypothetical protein
VSVFELAETVMVFALFATAILHAFGESALSSETVLKPAGTTIGIPASVKFRITASLSLSKLDVALAKVSQSTIAGF